MFVWDLPSTTPLRSARSGAQRVERLLAALRAGTTHLACRGSQSCTGGLVVVG